MRTLTLTLLLLSSAFTHAFECIKTRAAFDIGSGTTKLKVAKVDTCKQKIIKMLLESDLPVAYKADLATSKSNNLSDKVIASGFEAITILKQQAQKFSPSSFTAVATSAFRTATNGSFAVKEIQAQTGIKINIISQNQEAKIGFVGASSISDKDPSNLVVWDIGGGSMQMTAYDKNGKFIIYEGKLASVSFKNHIIKDVQHNSLENFEGPNPIKPSTRKTSMRDAAMYAKFSVPNEIKEKLQDPKAQVLGIGGVHYYSIGKELSESKTYSINMLASGINKKLNLTNPELGGGEYVDTSVSNLILVEGFMKQLGINSVKTGKVNLADGLLISPSLADKDQ